MDCKELIERLRKYDGLLPIAKDAATAIENLLAEREAERSRPLDLRATFDMYGGEYGITEAFRKAAEREAAMKYIPKVCSTCKHWDAGGCNAPITGGECAFDLRQAWQWRGPTPPDRERKERL